MFKLFITTNNKIKKCKFNKKLYGINIRYYENGKNVNKCYFKNDKIEGKFIYRKKIYFIEGKFIL
jgi:antitoxin component YwqK of YwqJK toxin-antitoxin module